MLSELLSVHATLKSFDTKFHNHITVDLSDPWTRVSQHKSNQTNDSDIMTCSTSVNYFPNERTHNSLSVHCYLLHVNSTAWPLSTPLATCTWQTTCKYASLISISLVANAHNSVRCGNRLGDLPFSRVFLYSQLPLHMITQKEAGGEWELTIAFNRRKTPRIDYLNQLNGYEWYIRWPWTT